MKKLIYKLTYPDGFTILTEVRANIPVDTLVKVQDAWKNMNIQADLVNIE